MNPTPERPWLPIEQAPKDGTWIEARWNHVSKTLEAQWVENEGWFGRGGLMLDTPNHFRPLPSTETTMPCPKCGFHHGDTACPTPEMLAPSTETGERACIFGDSWDTVPPTAADRKRCGCRRCLSTDPLTPSAEEERWRILEDPLFQLRLFGTFLQGGSPNELRNRVDEELTRRKMKLEGITPKEIHDDLQALKRAAEPQ